MSKAQETSTKTESGATGTMMAHRRWPFEDLLTGWPLTDVFAHEWNDLLERTGSFIRIEETQHDGDLVVRAELPGINPDKDVKVTLDGDMLTIHAERRDERHEEEGGTRRTEFHYGTATRRLRVPSGTDPSAVKATYKDGILEVHVPMPKAEPTAREITVERSGS